MESLGLDLPTLTAAALLSLLLAWLVVCFLDNREEKKRELEMQKAMDRLLRPRNFWDDLD